MCKALASELTARIQVQVCQTFSCATGTLRNPEFEVQAETSSIFTCIELLAFVPFYRRIEIELYCIEYCSTYLYSNKRRVYRLSDGSEGGAIKAPKME